MLYAEDDEGAVQAMEECCHSFSEAPAESAGGRQRHLQPGGPDEPAALVEPVRASTLRDAHPGTPLQGVQHNIPQPLPGTPVVHPSQASVGREDCCRLLPEDRAESAMAEVT